MVKSVKRALETAVGCQILSFSQLQTVSFESAHLVNTRPIGEHPMDPDDGAYLSPNDLLLGRSSNAIPQGPFRNVKISRMFFFLQEIVSNFWKKWTRDYFPSLIIQQKWHTAQRNVSVDDVVLVRDNNALRGSGNLAA